MKRNVKRALKTMVKHSGKRIYYSDEGSTVIVGNGSIFFRIFKSEYEEFSGECFAKCKLMEVDKKSFESVKKDGELANMQNMLCYSGDVLTRIYKSSSGEIIGIKEDYVNICRDLEMIPATLIATGKNAPLYNSNVIILPIATNYKALLEHVLGVDA